jgi:hypothetical protein
VEIFYESRWRTSLPWFVLSAILIGVGSVSLQFIATYCKWPLRFAAAVVFSWAVWKLLHPGKAIILDGSSIVVKGVRPGWWKLFQRSTWVRISDHDIEDIRIGRIREDWLFGLKTPPAGEPSKGAAFQNFLWIRYTSAGGRHEIYYPEIYDIQSSKLLVSRLKERFGGKVNIIHADE